MGLGSDKTGGPLDLQSDLLLTVLLVPVLYTVRLTCVAAVMETTKDGTLEQLKFTKRPWKIELKEFYVG